jgi:hypothetical protein
VWFRRLSKLVDGFEVYIWITFHLGDRSGRETSVGTQLDLTMKDELQGRDVASSRYNILNDDHLGILTARLASRSPNG